MPLAGSARLPYSQFLAVDAMGALLWSGAFIMAGYVLSDQVETMGARLRRGEVALAGALVIGFLGYLGMKLWRRRRYGAGVLDAGHS